MLWHELCVVILLTTWGDRYEHGMFFAWSVSQQVSRHETQVRNELLVVGILTAKAHIIARVSIIITSRYE